MTDAAARRRLGRILVAKGVIKEFQLHHALAFQRLDGRQLGEILVELGLASSGAIAQALDEQGGTDPTMTPLTESGAPGEVLLAARILELDERETALEARERAFAVEMELYLGQVEEFERDLSAREERLIRREGELVQHVARMQEGLSRQEAAAQMLVASVAPVEESDAVAVEDASDRLKRPMAPRGLRIQPAG